MADYWGYHLILDVAGCDKNRATDPEHIRAFAKALVAAWRDVARLGASVRRA